MIGLPAPLTAGGLTVRFQAWRVERIAGRRHGGVVAIALASLAVLAHLLLAAPQSLADKAQSPSQFCDDDITLVTTGTARVGTGHGVDSSRSIGTGHGPSPRCPEGTSDTAKVLKSMKCIRGA